jgi:protein tyrosine kinase modulator
MAIVKSDDFQIEPVRPSHLPTPGEIGAAVFRQRWIVLATIVVVAVMMWWMGIWVPKYVAQMKILVLRQRVDAVITPEANSPVQWGGDQVSEEDLNSEVELLKSTDLLRKVVVETGLDHDPAMTPQSTPERAIAAAAWLLEKHLKIEAIRKTNMISVQYESRNPTMASKVLNALSEAYAEKHIEVHRPSGEFKFFDQQATQYRQSLTELNKKLLLFNEENGVVSPNVERDLALQRVNDFDASAHQAQEAVQEGMHRIEVLRQQLVSLQPQVTGAVRNFNNEALIGQLKETLSTLELKRTELLGRYSPAYRPIQDLDGQIAELKGTIAKEVSSPLHEETTTANPVYQWVQGELARTEAEVTTMKARVDAASAIAAQYRGKAQGLNQQSVLQEDLLRDEKAQEENYLLYMHKREEARSSDALDQRGIVNVAIAQHPVTPSFPVRTTQYAALMTLLICVTFGVSAAFVADLMVPSFRTPDEIVRYLDAPVLACLPKGEPL